nr:DEAD/DEAH box helicase family protein [Angustibacter aerolatus]
MTASTDSAAPSSVPGTRTRLRAWQAEAIERYEVADPEDFLVTATPGAGKTTFGLTLALRLKSRRLIDRVIVVAPTDHLRTQWADAAVRTGLVLDPNLPNSVGPVRAGADGYVTTYAQVAAHPLLHRRRTENKRTLVILDEVHHAGDSLSWGDAVTEAFDPARRRLSLTGTPFRTKPTERIPFVRYVSAGPGEPDERGRLRLRLPRGARRPRGAAGRVRGLLRRQPLDEQRRRGAGRPARRGQHQGGRGGRLAHRARPRGRLGAARHRRRRRPHHPPARAGHGGRRRADPRLRPGRRPRLRQDRPQDHR